MLLNSLYNRIIDSCGWVDQSSLLIIDLPSKKSSSIKISDCSYITVKALSQENFICAEHFEGERLVLSIRSFGTPASVLASVVITADNLVFSGNDALWENAPHYYIEYLKHPFQGNDYRLIDLRSKPASGVFPSLEWFDDSYDKGYQGIMDVIEIPESQFLLFSIQRSSSPVLYDPNKRMIVKKIHLAGRGGNPIFSFNKSKTDIWCVDYDTLLKISISDFKIIKSIKLQGPGLGAIMQFIGNFSLSPDERYCAVARPFSSDVVLLDSNSFKIISHSKSKKQPLSVVLLPNLEYICRDWKSGVIEFGRFDIKKDFLRFFR